MERRQDGGAGEPSRKFRQAVAVRTAPSRQRRGTVLAPLTRMTAAVFYATREGHTKKVAERIAADLRTRGALVDTFDVRDCPAPDWSRYSTACLAASVHRGHHEKEMVVFAKTHRDALVGLDAAFVSVTLSEAGAEDPTRSADERRAAAEDAQRMIDVFVGETGWHPEHALSVAGALAYSKYNLLVRFLMKRIARKAGAPTDTRRDYEFTDWPAVDRFVGELADRTH
jgi:menaquinone-dependent protoporphyrinogen oxidase